jgi:hypothetical protein
MNKESGTVQAVPFLLNCSAKKYLYAAACYVRIY